ncbi:hypothetical protein N5P37_004526, partial [Trichoderma harzianum]
CDCTRPLCQRCRTGDRRCTWDSDEQTGLHFRSENAFAMGLQRRPPKTSGSQAPGLMGSGSTFSLVSNNSRIQPALSLPLEMHALYYFADSVSTERHILGNGGPEYSPHVLHHWELAKPDSCLRLALEAYSHALIGRKRDVRPALCLSQRVYAKAVEEIQNAMSTISSDTIYQVMLAMMLMGGYENIMYFAREYTAPPPDAVGSRFWKSVCHEKGAASLLSARRERGFAADTELDKAIRQKCLRIIILRGGAMPAWLEDGSDWGEEGHELELDSLIIRVLTLRNKSISFLRDMDNADPEIVNEVKSIAMEAYALDYDLASWPLGLAQDWRFQVSRTHPQPSLNAVNARANTPSHTYSSVGHAAIWNRYRALRLITNSIQKRAFFALKSLSDGYIVDENMQRCQVNINNLAVDLRCGVEFSLTSQAPARGAKVTTFLDEPHPSIAALLAWPLTVAVSVDAVELPEKTWLKGVLKAVARSLGHTLLESVSDHGEFKF